MCRSNRVKFQAGEITGYRWDSKRKQSQTPKATKTSTAAQIGARVGYSDSGARVFCSGLDLIVKIAYLSSAWDSSRPANSIHVMKMCQALASAGHDGCPSLQPSGIVATWSWWLNLTITVRIAIFLSGFYYDESKVLAALDSVCTPLCK